MNDTISLDLTDGETERVGAALRARAALWVWVIGLVQAVLFGCFGLSVALMASIPMDQLQNRVNEQQFEQLKAAYPMLGAVAIMVLLLGFLPGVIYLVLGFAIRGRRALAIDIALLLAITQSIVFGLVLVNNIVFGLAQGGPLSVTFNVLTIGSLLALLGHGIRLLWSVRKFGRESLEESDTDPWNDF